MQHSSGFLQLVEKAKEKINEVSPEMVKKSLDLGQDLYIIDVREDNEWQQGHIPGAIHLSKGVIERDIEGQLPNKNTPLILYCSGGFRSLLAANNLYEMGYTHISSLQGGLKKWYSLGYSIAN